MKGSSLVDVGHRFYKVFCQNRCRFTAFTSFMGNNTCSVCIVQNLHVIEINLWHDCFSFEHHWNNINRKLGFRTAIKNVLIKYNYLSVGNDFIMVTAQIKLFKFIFA